MKALGKSLLKFWDRLTAPMDFVPHNDRRRARLLSATLMVFVILSMIVIVVIPLVTAKLVGTAPTLPIDFVIEEFVYLGIYGLSRTRYYRVSALLLTVMVNLVVWSVTITAPNFNGPQLLAIVVVLAGLLLSTRTTAILLALNFVGLVTGALVQQKTNFNPSVDFGTDISIYILFVGLFLIHLQYRDLIEKDRIVEALRAEEQSRVADQLRALDLIKSRFLASMSHELRTPLNSILNFTEFVLNEVFGPVNAEQADALRNVVNSGDFLLSLINDVLDMTKIESGSLELFIEEVDLKDVIKASLTTAQGLLQGKPVTLIENISSDLPVISGDKRRIQQILNNLMSNAIKFTAQGSITFEAARDGESNIRFTIHDTGMGIVSADQELIFQPFRQTKQGIQQGAGTGLGLPISRSLTEAHGGKLTMESKPGEGTTFHVVLPLKARTTATA
ncbi:MAG: HAMP domain-containing sensor histidine kinase [Chloroflexota bacterium]